MLTVLSGALAVAIPSDTRAQASTETSNESVPLDTFSLIPCTLHPVHLTGEEHILDHSTVNPDGSVHVVSHVNLQDVSGTNTFTGEQYRATGATDGETNINVGETSTFVVSFQLIGQGSAVNYRVHETFHVTIDANGVITSTVDKISIECE